MHHWPAVSAITAYSLRLWPLGFERGWLVAGAVAAGGWLLAWWPSRGDVAGSGHPGARRSRYRRRIGAHARTGATAVDCPGGTGRIVVRMAYAVSWSWASPSSRRSSLVLSTVSGLLAMLPMSSGRSWPCSRREPGGPIDGSGVQRGILSGLFGTAAFLAVVAWAVTPWGAALVI